MGEPAKYILLVDRVVRFRLDVLFILLGKREALRGDIFEALPEAEQPSDGDSIVLELDEITPSRLRVSKKDVTRLSDEEANLLLPISCLGERYATFIDTKRLDFGRRLSPGKAVFVSEKGHTKYLPGVVRYKGELPTCPGTMFGVELIVGINSPIDRPIVWGAVCKLLA